MESAVLFFYAFCMMPFVVWAALGIAREMGQMKVRAAWAEAADELGLSFQYINQMDWEISGVVDGFAVNVETFRERSADYLWSSIRIVVAGGSRIPRGLTLGAKVRLESVKDLFSAAEDVQIDEASVLAGLSRPNRIMIESMVASGAKVENGAIFFETRGTRARSEEIVLRIQEMVEVASRLAYQMDNVPRALAENAASDDDWRIRRRNLQVLIEQFEKTPDCQTALGTALKDASHAIRLVAAGHLLDERAFAVLEAMVDEPSADDAHRTEALSILANGYSYQRTSPIVARALATSSAALQQLALQTIGEKGDADMLEKVCACTAADDATTAAAAACALGKLDDSRAEPALIRLLDHSSEQVRREAIVALGLVGTIRAVEPLLPFTKGLVADSDLKQAVRDSIRRIQAKLGPADAGLISLVDKEENAGALSIADEGGEVSVAPSTPPNRSPTH